MKIFNVLIGFVLLMCSLTTYADFYLCIANRTGVSFTVLTSTGWRGAADKEKTCGKLYCDSNPMQLAQGMTIPGHTDKQNGGYGGYCGYVEGTDALEGGENIQITLSGSDGSTVGFTLDNPAIGSRSVIAITAPATMTVVGIDEPSDVDRYVVIICPSSMGSCSL